MSSLLNPLPAVSDPWRGAPALGEGWQMVYVTTMLRYALTLGVIGFAAGFFGPMLLAPDANQGPLLGIFITGPLGVTLGAALGLVVAFVRHRS